MCFGDSKKEAVETSLQRGATGAESQKNRAFVQALPFFQQRMNQGFPYLKQFTDYAGGTSARAAAPRRGGVIRNMRNAGMSANDPAYQATLGDFEAGRARSFDDQMRQALQLDEATRTGAAQGLFNYGASDPMAYYNLLSQLITA